MDTATPAADVAAPEQFVELMHLKDGAGAPVRVRVIRISQVEIQEIFQGVASPVPQAGLPEDELSIAAMRRGVECVEILIERAVAEPEFRRSPSDGQLPMTWLSTTDLALLAKAIKAVAGLEEVPEALATFRNGN